MGGWGGGSLSLGLSRVFGCRAADASRRAEKSIVESKHHCHEPASKDRKIKSQSSQERLRCTVINADVSEKV